MGVSKRGLFANIIVPVND